MRLSILVFSLGLVMGCAKTPTSPLAEADLLLDQGSPRQVLALLGPEATPDESPELSARRVIAALEMHDWGRAERLMHPIIRDAPPIKAALMCLLAAERRDVNAVTVCETARTTPEGQRRDALGDAIARAHALALESDFRREDAEKLLRDRTQARKTTANRRTLIAYLERQGLVKDVVAELEQWRQEVPGDKSLDDKLAMALDRKVRGDLLEKRGAEAEAAARSLLALKPQRQEIRYFLADALELQGKPTEAAAERATAKAAGAVPPTPPEGIPGTGHDHDHDKPHDSGRLLGDTPKAPPSASPDPAPKASPAPAPKASPSASPDPAPKTSPDAAPKASPSASPDPAPKASPSASPDPAPKTSPAPAPADGR